jgi:ribonucleoside-triphosphate reductase
MASDALHNYSMSDFQQYVYTSRYAKYLHDAQRRETWSETVTRYFDFFTDHLDEQHNYKLDSKLRTELEQAVLSMEIMPSMRCMMTAGAALKRDHGAGYNCSYAAIDTPKTFSEILFTLMCGTGVGFSVERQYVVKLPAVPDEFYPTDSVIVVADSRIGWAKALNELVSMLYTGAIPKWDTSKLRPSGAILKTFGGRSSGPEPLERLFRFVVQTFKEAVGRKLTSIECHDLACMIGECVVVGGVRRSAMISLSNLSDDRMRSAKSGQWWAVTPWRSLANNSAVYNDKRPPMETFMSEWKALYDSKSGERGIFSRYAAKNIIERANDFRKQHFLDTSGLRMRDSDHEWGCNPCSEIILRDKQFCNLTEGIIRSTDTVTSLKRKVRLATILGTFQSTLTNFRFLSKKWKDNTADERLLGVSLTGIMDNELMSGSLGFDKLKDALTEIRKVAIATNLEFANAIGIEASTAVTCVKPSGTVSSLVDSASGIHRRHSPYYIRTVRSDKKDPVAQLMIDQGCYYEEDKMRPDHNWVFSFPTKAPDTALVRHDDSAINQLEIWLMYQKYWCDHKPSVTVSVKEDEWLEVGAWVFKNFEWMSGVSFLPYSEHTYEQAPYQDITEAEYHAWIAKVPSSVDWSKLPEYEKVDSTIASQTLACSSGGCDL